VAMIGVGVAERSGLFSAALKALVAGVPSWLMTTALVFAGINASLAVDAGYVILVPLGAVLFAGIGRHPIVGLAAAFAGVSGGFSANIFLTALDPLLAGLTQEAARRTMRFWRLREQADGGTPEQPSLSAASA